LSYSHTHFTSACLCIINIVLGGQLDRQRHQSSLSVGAAGRPPDSAHSHHHTAARRPRRKAADCRSRFVAYGLQVSCFEMVNGDNIDEIGSIRDCVNGNAEKRACMEAKD